MAQVFRSLDSYMQDLALPPSAPSASYDLGGEQPEKALDAYSAPQASQPDPVSQPASVAPPGSQPAPAPAPAQQAAGGSINTPQVELQPFSSVDTSGLYGDLFGGVGGALSQGEEQARGLVGGFNENVTPFRDYESSGAQEAVQGFLETGQGEEQARGFANASTEARES